MPSYIKLNVTVMAIFSFHNRSSIINASHITQRTEPDQTGFTDRQQYMHKILKRPNSKLKDRIAFGSV
jgi:hypothetical protein